MSKIRKIAVDVEPVFRLVEGIVYPSLKESEDELAKIIATDPLCYKTYFSTKGLKKGNVSFDDRTYIRFKV